MTRMIEEKKFLSFSPPPTHASTFEKRNGKEAEETENKENISQTEEEHRENARSSN